MKVVFVATHYPPTEVGGSGESVWLIAEGLRGLGHQVTVVTPDWATGPHPDGMPSEAYFHSPSWHLEIASAVRHACPVDVIHAQDRRVLVGTYLAARLVRAAAVLTLRDPGLLCPVAVCLNHWPSIPLDCGQKKLWFRCASEHLGRFFWPTDWRGWAPRLRLAGRFALLSLERRLATKYRAVAYVSEALRRLYAPWLPGVVLPSAMPDAVPPTWSRVSTGQPGFFGRASTGKGWPDYVDACRLLRVDPERREGLSRDEVYGQMVTEFDTTVVPPRRLEAMPRVALEALALGRPVIGTAVGGLPEILPDEWLVPPGNPRALAEALRTVMDDPRKADDKALVWRAHLWKKHSPEAVARAHLALYESLGDRRKTGEFKGS